MGTLVQIDGAAASPAVLTHGLDGAIAAIRRVDALLSFHDPASELSRLNTCTGVATPVHPISYAALRRALRFAADSDGVFDPSVAPRLVTDGHLPRPSGPVPLGTWRDIELLPQRRVRFRRRVWIDLGGIAKGLAVDLAIHALRRAGCRSAIVNAGGDLRCFGPTPQLIHVRGEIGVTPLAWLRYGAVATSVPRPTRPTRSERMGYIVDSRRGTGGSVGSLFAGPVSVAAGSCVVADALTKVAALLGPSCREFLARYGAVGRWPGAA
jgi:thiamine biosynthesis lipoprotein